MDLVFSDIHADIEGLETILDVAFSSEFEEKYGKASRIINLGDLLERGTSPKQVLQKMSELAKSFPMISVMGNHDEGFLYKKFLSGSSYASLKEHELLSNQDTEFFRQNKDGTFGDQFVIDRKDRLFCVHGGPVNPDKIAKKGDDPWLYQRTWQRLSEEDYEFFSYSGYHYKAESAFGEAKAELDNFLILCGHQHMEAAIRQTGDEITNILPSRYETEKISQYTLRKRQIPIEKNSNYLVRTGLGGPQGYYGGGFARPHFGIIQDDPRQVIFFELE
ncbi:metallophosphoesterase family protein [Candidatus Nitrosotenuis aquarius]|uniref:metallophosphoesterase family protein n=1 Tax=Candidatus Nitrosotenuis aquarius TaxID=1846278 RepID=UPI000C1F0FCD|nr:metallophosphoesterase [Candidatus Nitrosotenuis aquarius]